jgi:hypothetical protein
VKDRSPLAFQRVTLGSNKPRGNFQPINVCFFPPPSPLLTLAGTTVVVLALHRHSFPNTLDVFSHSKVE